jgi:oligosaccharide repeat unit polymerase
MSKKNLKGDSVSLSTIFMTLWFVIVLFSSLHLYKLYDIDSFVYLLVLIGSTSFFIGYSVLGSYYLFKKGAGVNKEKVIPYSKFRLLYYAFLIFAIYIVIKQIILLLPIIIASGMSDARTEMQLDETLVIGGGWDILLGYFAKPFVLASIIIILVNLFKHKLRIFQLSFISILLLLYFLSEGGRGVLLNVLFAILYLVYINRKRLDNSSKRIIKFTLPIAVALPFMATIERGSRVFSSIYVYYCGGLQYLSQILNKYSYVFNESLYGLTCYQGFFKPFFGVLELLGIEKPELLVLSNEFILYAQDTVVYVAPSEPMNFFMTCYGYAYKDGGIIGIILCFFIYGVLCSFVDRMEIKGNNSVRWCSVKVVFLYTLFFTISIFPFSKFLNAMTVIYIFIITNKFLMKNEKLHIRKNN